MSSHVFQSGKMIVFSSIKGGSGVTVVAGLAALAAARAGVTTTVSGFDLDLATALGISDLEGRAGLSDLLTSRDVTPTAIEQLSMFVRPRLSLLPPGTALVSSETCVSSSVASHSLLVVDASGSNEGVRGALMARAVRSYMVVRPCLLTVRRLAEATPATAKIDGLVVVDEPRRILGPRDLEDVSGIPVVASVRLDSAVARAVDTGRLGYVGQRAIRDLESITSLVASPLVSPLTASKQARPSRQSGQSGQSKWISE